MSQGFGKRASKKFIDVTYINRDVEVVEMVTFALVDTVGTPGPLETLTLTGLASEAGGTHTPASGTLAPIGAGAGLTVASSFTLRHL